MTATEPPAISENTKLVSVPGIIAIIGAVVGAIGSLAASTVLVLGALNDTTDAVELSALSQDKKLDEIHVQTNSNLSELKSQLALAMAELANAREDLAALAGREAERDKQNTDNQPDTE